ncbi:MAG: hypothetical protein B6I36_06390 [Desulfobacteraceae bacterium 4572_35.1]|nr:MAG: hypothetical protein B6I36_06390 [Desulfobacteraceae bacterium 4572_35.1]
MYKKLSSLPAISIVGIGGVFPQAANLEKFWDIVKNGQRTASTPPNGRWRLPVDEVYNREEGKLDCVYSKQACFIDDFKLNLPFKTLNIDEATVSNLDPLFQLLLHAGYQAFSDAETSKIDLGRVGVIVGNLALPSETASQLAEEYLGRTFAEKVNGSSDNCDRTNPINRFMTGLPATVLAKAFGLGGRCHTLDAACASSLYAIKLAVDELQSGRADAMLSGGVARPDSQYTQMGFSQLHALSPTGVCSPFDRSGNGLVVGEGAGVVLLKRTVDAIRDDDHIYAQITGIGVSSDIGGSLLAPITEGQLRAMRAAYRQAGWQPQEVDHIECHATGTPVGDAVEFNSLKQLWSNVNVKHKCVLGSVKSNIGHLLTAAGSAALLKTLLALKTQTLPPTAGFQQANPQMEMESSPFEVLSKAQPWTKPTTRPRRAAVSAFGFGGINAHLLLEEWQPQTIPAIHADLKQAKTKDTDNSTCEPIAIVGMDIQLGPWRSLKQFRHQALGECTPPQFSSPKNWHAATESRWFRDEFKTSQFRGHYLDKVKITPGQFRIPPTELKEMLPRQALMLKSMATALENAVLDDVDHTDSGVFIGNGIDLNATNFSLRWALPKLVKQWAIQQNLDLDDQQLEQWQHQLQEAISAPLTANRTMGSLGSVVASRIAREFKVGGPSFTIASEENSGMQALHTAVSALHRKEIKLAMVGAVDMPGDIRAQLSQFHLGRYDAIAEGACSLILKPLSAAQTDNNTIYAVIDATASSCDGSDLINSGVEAVQRSLKQLCTTAKISSDTIGYVDISTYSNHVDEQRNYLQDVCSSDCRITSSPSVFGHSGEVSGLVGIIQGALSLYHCILPATKHTQQKEHSNRYWLHNSQQGPRRALISSSGTGGICNQTLLSQWQSAKTPLPPRLSTSTPEAALFCIYAPSIEELQQQLQRLDQHQRSNNNSDLAHTAAIWHENNKHKTGLKITIVSSSTMELTDQIQFALEHLQTAPQERLDGRGGAVLPACARDKIFYAPQPLAATGDVAFVFPGSGNHFSGMGRDLALQWPAIFENQHRHNLRLKDQYCPQVFWNNVDPEQINTDHNSMIIAHVALCTALSDSLRSFGIQPKAAIGYSLGESSSLFSLQVWRDRDEMLKRIENSTLFTTDLAGPCMAARKLWNLSEDENVEWCLGIIPLTASQVKPIIDKYDHAYLLIINTPEECIIGGNRDHVTAVINKLGCPFIELHGVTTVHCPVPTVVAKRYRDLHLFPTTAPESINFYSCASSEIYPPNSDSCADAILAQAVESIDFTKVINNAYADGVRIFIESGSGNSCSRMISRILADRPHMVRPTCLEGQPATTTMAKLLGQLIAEGVVCDPSQLYIEVDKTTTKNTPAPICLHNGAATFELPPTPQQTLNSFEVGNQIITTTPTAIETNVASDIASSIAKDHGAETSSWDVIPVKIDDPVLGSMYASQLQQSAAHEQFLQLSQSIQQLIERNLHLQQHLSAQIPAQQLPKARPIPAESNIITAPASKTTKPQETVQQHNSRHQPRAKKVAFDRDMCMEFAIGSIEKVLGTQFASIDSHPTRVRLPDEPLMLVDRIISVEGEPCSMSHGRVVTEHDVTSDRWYLDGGRIPTCVAVEAGQADLFLSGYLGIDKHTKGMAVYRLLDAIVQFHGSLPQPGDTIHYDIRVERFFRQGDTWLFRFNYDCSVNGKALMTMRNGCAGFFTRAELEAGRGIVHTKFDLMPQTGKRPDDWQPLVPMVEESYSVEQIQALRRGDLAACFGSEFKCLNITNPYTLPSGHLELVDRVTSMVPDGGRFGLGQIRAQMNINPDDWFLTCHFCDDNVMPGTLMYECCLHTLRIYLMRMGWVSAKNEGAWEPVPGVNSQLKCRGQVTEKTNTVTYEVTIKELGYRPEPYAIVDALMYADDKAIVEITNMTVQISGLNREKLSERWKHQLRDGQPTQPIVKNTVVKKTALFDYASILAYSNGNPSDAFGEPYRIFDNERKIARLPRPPFQFLDRITQIDTQAWKMVAGGSIEAQYDVPTDAWYFQAERHNTIPFCVLLEIALQPCGWMAAYVGSALTSDTDLSFRNLDGNAIQVREVNSYSETLTINVTLTNVSSSGGMIIQSYDFCVSDQQGPVYQGDTVFGFFSKQALANQVGIRELHHYQPSSEEIQRSIRCPYPQQPPFPDTQLRMIDHINSYIADGGSNGLGYICATKKVNPDEWFFKAHFYQDPVCPGSLGLESHQQLLKFIAVQRWGTTETSIFEPITLNNKHSWTYRGQIIPRNNEVKVEAMITKIDDNSKTLWADGILSVDGKIIYQMKDFSIRMIE